MAIFQNIQDLAKAKPANRVRVRIGGEVSVWAKVEGNTVTLGHEYEDFSPQPGMAIVGRGVNLVIASVSGRVLNCEV